MSLKATEQEIFILLSVFFNKGVESIDAVGGPMIFFSV